MGEHRIGKEGRHLEGEAEEEERRRDLAQLSDRVAEAGDQGQDEEVDDCGEQHPLQGREGRAKPADRCHCPKS